MKFCFMGNAPVVGSQLTPHHSEHHTDNGCASAFTLVELLIVIAVLSVLVVVLYTPPNQGARVYGCMSNIRQVGIGLQMWADDHGKHFPMEVSVTNGGSMERIGTGSPAAHFQTITNYMRSLHVWVCPTDESRKQATAEHPGRFSDETISYFLSIDAKPTVTNAASFILGGDRHLRLGRQPIRRGLVRISTNDIVSWTRELHKNRGTLVFADAHAEFTKVPNLHLTRHDTIAIRLAIP